MKRINVCRFITFHNELHRVSFTGMLKGLLISVLMSFTILSTAQTVTKQLYLSDPAQALDRIDPVASADATTAQTVVLGGASAISQVSTPASVSVGTGVTNYSFSYNSGTTGIDRMLVVGIAYRNNSSQTVTSVTYGGQALTLVGTAANSTMARVYIYSLLNPANGSNTLTVNWNASLGYEAVIGAVVYQGVNQTTPIGTFSSSTGTGSTQSVAVSGSSGSVMVGVIGGRATTAYTPTTSGNTLLCPFPKQLIPTMEIVNNGAGMILKGLEGEDLDKKLVIQDIEYFLMTSYP